MSFQPGHQPRGLQVAPKYRQSCERLPQGGNGAFRSQSLQKEVDFLSCSSSKPSSNLALIKGLIRKLDDPEQGSREAESPLELTKIYLKCLHGHFIHVLEQSLSPSVVKSTQMDFVVTVPAIWSEAAKQATERAAAMAGFCGNKRINLISEPVGTREASLMIS